MSNHITASSAAYLFLNILTSSSPYFSRTNSRAALVKARHPIVLRERNFSSSNLSLALTSSATRLLFDERVILSILLSCVIPTEFLGKFLHSLMLIDSVYTCLVTFRRSMFVDMVAPIFWTRRKRS